MALIMIVKPSLDSLHLDSEVSGDALIWKLREVKRKAWVR